MGGAEALATDRAPSVDATVDPQQRFEELRARRVVLGGFGELPIEDLPGALEHGVVYE